jgi:hypothetical protein
MRINAFAQGDSSVTSRLRKEVVFDRMIARLISTAPDRWIVKGGVALDLRLRERARATKDLDLARRDDEAAATEDLLTAIEAEVHDFFVFSADRSQGFDEIDDNVAIRFDVRAELAGRRFEEIKLDIGFGDPLPLVPELVRGTDLLTFAGITPTSIPTLPLEQHIAEKVHAYTRQYSGGRENSRVKDLVDILLLCSSHRFAANALRTALEQLFLSRRTHELPTRLPAPPSSWTTPFRVLAAGLALDTDLDVAFVLAASFLDPVLAAVDLEGEWNPGSGSWA